MSKAIGAHNEACSSNSGESVDHPTTGPVRTKDAAVAMFNLVAHLMDPSADVLSGYRAMDRAAACKEAS